MLKRGLEDVFTNEDVYASQQKWGRTYGKYKSSARWDHIRDMYTPTANWGWWYGCCLPCTTDAPYTRCRRESAPAKCSDAARVSGSLSTRGRRYCQARSREHHAHL